MKKASRAPVRGPYTAVLSLDHLEQGVPIIRVPALAVG